MGFNELKELLQRKKGNHGIDVVVFASGGKDSSYALYVASQHVVDSSRIMAVTMDNGFLSDGAHRNLKNISERLGVQHEYGGINQDTLFSFYKKLAQAGQFNPRSICVGCNILLARMEWEALLKYQPPFFVTGNNSREYSLFRQWLVRAGIKGKGTKNREFEFRHGFWEYNEKILQDVLGHWSTEYQSLSVPEPKADDEISHCERINVFEHVPYDSGRMLTTLQTLGWQFPADVVGTETDCKYTQAITFAYISKYGNERYKELIHRLVVDKQHDSKTGQRAIDNLKNLQPELAQRLISAVGYNKENTGTSPVLKRAVTDLLPIR